MKTLPSGLAKFEAEVEKLKLHGPIPASDEYRQWVEAVYKSQFTYEEWAAKQERDNAFAQNFFR